MSLDRPTSIGSRRRLRPALVVALAAFVGSALAGDRPAPDGGESTPARRDPELCVVVPPIVGNSAEQTLVIRLPTGFWEILGEVGVSADVADGDPLQRAFQFSPDVENGRSQAAYFIRSFELAADDVVDVGSVQRALVGRGRDVLMKLQRSLERSGGSVIGGAEAVEFGAKARKVGNGAVDGVEATFNFRYGKLRTNESGNVLIGRIFAWRRQDRAVVVAGESLTEKNVDMDTMLRAMTWSANAPPPEVRSAKFVVRGADPQKRFAYRYDVLTLGREFAPSATRATPPVEKFSWRSKGVSVSFGFYRSGALGSVDEFGEAYLRDAQSALDVEAAALPWKGSSGPEYINGCRTIVVAHPLVANGVPRLSYALVSRAADAAFIWRFDLDTEIRGTDPRLVDDKKREKFLRAELDRIRALVNTHSSWTTY